MKTTIKLQKPDYGNWVSLNFVYVPGVLGIIFLSLALLTIFWLIPAAVFLLVSIYFFNARYQFSPGGRDIQHQIRTLLMQHLDWDGKGQALDIGCGNGALSIDLAQKYPASLVTGIDTWGGNWEYSHKVCETNAEIEGVKPRIMFRKASASTLPFEDESFEVAVSNLVFHEVSTALDKRVLIREALRVVKKGGKFAFQDLFFSKNFYGDPEDLLETIEGWGISKVELIETRKASFIPGLLKLPFMLGDIGLIVGEK